MYDSAIRVAICVILSASGSINFPNFVMQLNFLAINPSSTSVIPDIVKNINAAIKFLFTIAPNINGIKTNLHVVNMFGICLTIFFPPLLDIKF